MRVAIVHDWLTGLRGGERVLGVFLAMYPDAKVHTLLWVPGTTSNEIDRAVVETSFLQKFPGIEKNYRYFLPLYPFAIRSLDLRGYDLVISLSHAAAKNVSVPEGVPHICYCFTPMRYIWDQSQSYLGSLTPLAWPVIRALRAWDLGASQHVDRFVAISRFVAARIRCFYGRDAQVIYPPVDTSWFPLSVQQQNLGQGEAFLYAGALVPYKRPDLVIEAFNKSKQPLWVVGSGPKEAELRAKAQPNIQFFGRVSDQELAHFYHGCRALIFSGAEDFGIVPIECLAAGRPVIGQFSGALRESLNAVKPAHHKTKPGRNSCGVFFAQDTVESLSEALEYFVRFEQSFSAESCRNSARRFSVRNFCDQWQELVSQHLGTGQLPASQSQSRIVQNA